MTVMLCVQLWAREGRRGDLEEYENTVLALLDDHGARLVARSGQAESGERTGRPAEVQLIELPSQHARRPAAAGARRGAGRRDRPYGDPPHRLPLIPENDPDRAAM